MKPLCLPLLFILYMVPAISLADPIDNIAGLIRQANIHELSKYFPSNVDVTILDQENMYSTVQAELVLDKFFKENKPRNLKMLHKVNSNTNYRFGVMIVNTDKGNFRVTCTLKQTNGSLMLIEMRIETEKIK